MTWGGGSKLCDTYTVNVRIPDIRFGKPNEKASGYRTFGSFTVNVQKPNVRFSAFFTKLDRFIYKEKKFIYKTV